MEAVLKQWQECEGEIEDILVWLKDTRLILTAELPTVYDQLQAELNKCKVKIAGYFQEYITIYLDCLKISNSFALAAKQGRKACQRLVYLPVSKVRTSKCLYFTTISTYIVDLCVLIY
jgi:hypothetical protein